MSVSPEIEKYIVSQLEGAGTIRSRRMFGGVGLYIDDAFCGIIGADSGRLYLKVDDSNRFDFEQEGMEPFKTPKGTMSYYTVPEHVVEDAGLLRAWALKARQVATSPKQPRKRRQR